MHDLDYRYIYLDAEKSIQHVESVFEKIKINYQEVPIK